MSKTSKILYFGCIAIILALAIGASQVLADNEIAIEQVAQGDI